MKITLLKFGAAWCPSCEVLRKRGTLEKFAEAHPDVKVQVHDDNEEGSSKAWENKADEWGVKSIPVLIWVAGGKELFRSGDVTLAAIEKQYVKALKEVDG